MINTVTLCGSVRFLDDFHEANVELTKQGFSVITISMALPQSEQNTGLKEYLDLVHFNKILRSDAIFVVKGDVYIGKSTAREILWAQMQGKAITYRPGNYPWEAVAMDITQSTSSLNMIQKARETLEI